MSQFKVVNPVHETFFESTSRQSCYDWIVEFSGQINQAIVVTGCNTYRVGSFNLYIFEQENH